MSHRAYATPLRAILVAGALALVSLSCGPAGAQRLSPKDNPSAIHTAAGKGLNGYRNHPGPAEKASTRRQASPSTSLAPSPSAAPVLGASAVAGSAQTTGPTAGYVSRSGTQLLLGGQEWKFAGYNLPCAQPFMLTDSQLGTYLDDIQLNSSANVVRVWFFQSNGGPGNWASFDRVIAALKARGMRAIPVLTNEWNDCEPTAQKSLAWYQGGYKLTGDGYPLSFRDFATQVAAHYANEPTIAFWQLVNEAQASSPDGSCNESAATAALRSFSDDVAGAIHGVDQHHLVNLGTLGSGQCGANGSVDYKNVHAGALDLCEYHDYGAAGQALPSNGQNGLAERIADCKALGKPIFVGESGIAANVQPDGTEPPCPAWPNCTVPFDIQTLQQRAAFFQAKIQAANNAGVVGYVVWFKSPFYDSAASDRYAIYDGDFTEGVLSAALTTTPPAAVPESPWTALLVTPAAALVGLALFLRRRRPRRVGAASPG